MNSSQPRLITKVTKGKSVYSFYFKSLPNINIREVGPVISSPIKPWFQDFQGGVTKKWTGEGIRTLHFPFNPIKPL